MFVMPSNFAAQADYQLNLQLINAIPQKVAQAITEILTGNVHLTSPRFPDGIFAFIGSLEHFGAKISGLSIRPSQACTKCGMCARECPAKKHQDAIGIPKFGGNCMWCLKCIYDCPSKVLSPGIMKFSVLKDGYNLKEMSEKAKTQC
ncbi:conserved hypothetical protein [[Clostridium] saccharolyticum WM1]|uniref:4Fe-4S ferredoxin-type domain-containing protein n=2 Tax=Lacrimispora TaxID=2719231 RepID=D9R9T2_LACSW|nr:conserved hypothetical protein [[Clostridium] saccharolyticum WM1]